MEYINLHQAIFTIEPDTIFSKSMKVPQGFWIDLYRRHKAWDYSHDDMQEWFNFKTNKQISKKTLYRWIIRQEVYNEAQRAIGKGSYLVNANFFGKNKDFVVKYKQCN